MIRIINNNIKHALCSIIVTCYDVERVDGVTLVHLISHFRISVFKSLKEYSVNTKYIYSPCWLANITAGQLALFPILRFD